jgi:hypothetical protein
MSRISRLWGALSAYVAEVRFRRKTRGLRPWPARSVREEMDLALSLEIDEQDLFRTFIGAEISPEEFDPDDLTRGGSFSALQDRPLDWASEAKEGFAPQYLDPPTKET